MTNLEGDDAGLDWKFDGKRDDELQDLFGAAKAETKGDGVIATK